MEPRIARRGLFKTAGALAAGLAGLKSAPEIRHAQQESLASGGWCAPSSLVYDIGSPDMEAFMELPELVVVRGGLRFS